MKRLPAIFAVLLVLASSIFCIAQTVEPTQADILSCLIDRFDQSDRHTEALANELYQLRIKVDSDNETDRQFVRARLADIVSAIKANAESDKTAIGLIASIRDKIELNVTAINEARAAAIATKSESGPIRDTLRLIFWIVVGLCGLGIVGFAYMVYVDFRK